MKKSSTIETIKQKLERLTAIQDDGCWMFLGPWNSHGYGHLSYDGQVFRAHRISYELHCSPVPEGKMVLHKCDHRYCINPEHLFIGTGQDNVDDMVTKGRDAFGDNFGENNGQARLTEDEVRQIRRLLASERFTQDEIGDMFGVTRGAVKMIKYGKTWRHLQ